MTASYIGLGSNLAQPTEQIKAAVQAISDLPDSELIQVSSLYSSNPMGPQDQPDYINAVVEINTQLQPIELLNALQAIELQQGRERKQRWGARTLDLDIILYGQQTHKDDRLTIPHYGMAERDFVLLPLQEIAPTLVLPNGETIDKLIQQCQQFGLKKLGKLDHGV